VPESNAPADVCHWADMDTERERLQVQCAEANDIDLVRILTIDRTHAVAALVDEAARELERRGLTVEGFLDRVQVRVGAEDEALVTIEQARSVIGADVPVHAVAAISHALGETMVLQREGWGWVFHHYDEDTYGESYLIEDEARASQTLDAFMRLQPWQPLAGDAHHLDNWETVVRTEEAQLVVDAAQKLTAAGVMHIVRSPLFTGEGDRHVALLVPQDDQDLAEETLGISHQSLRQLRQQASKLAEGEDRTAELAVYEQLARIDAGNGAVHYNHGVVLLELDRHEEAVACFLEAAAPTLGALPSRPETPRGRVGPGGIFAVLGVLTRHLGGPPSSHTPGPDYLEDIELRLQQLHGRFGDRIDLLHTMAGLARWRDDVTTARDLYERILRLNAADEVARFQLGYLAASMDDHPAKEPAA